ncbi:MAG: winged helix-turn-helix domain-containing protein [Robiginitomaculum sp.]|nr:winged helix-turn-helix domain-containing protein [Robiginitomaculum sp.]
MKYGPDISRIAALVGDPSRANILTALMDGRALTATELSLSANITKQTTSMHLSKLMDGQLLEQDKQGRHKYFRLKNPDVANMLEAIMGVAQTLPNVRVRTGPKDPALRKARICYDHLAGELGVSLYERFVDAHWINLSNDGIYLTSKGYEGLKALGVDINILNAKRETCRQCLDWSVRKYHLAGSLGAALLMHFINSRWAKRVEDTRIIQFSAQGEKALENITLAGTVLNNKQGEG